MNILALTICSALLISAGSSLVNGGDVPALIWSPTRSMEDLPQVFAGKKIDAANFHEKYLVPLAKGSKAFIVFLQDKLGLKSLSRYADIYNKDSEGGAFKNVKHFMEAEHSTNLPSVLEPMSAIDSLKKTFHNDLVEIHEPSKLASMDLKKDKPQLILVHLPDLTGKKNEEAVIRNNDDLIASMLEVLKKRGVEDYTAMLTASDAPEEETDSSHLGRHLLQVAPSANDTNVTGIYFNFPNCPFYAAKIVVFVKVGENVTSFLMNNIISNSSDCVNTTAKMAFTLQSENKALQVLFNLNFTISAMGGWKLISVNLDYTLNGKTENASLYVTDVGAPLGFSYHCTKQPLLKSNRTGPSNIVVQIDKLQVQAILSNNGTFSHVWDCTGFFTIGIWMGLFSTLILAMIIAFGLYMIMDIKTMDRFDDPKGKPFTVSTTDG